MLVTEVRRPEHTTTTAEATSIGLPLIWSGSSPPLTVASVHPGSERHIDLVHIDLPARDDETSALQLDVFPKPASGHDELVSGKSEISVEIRARNADTICYVIAVDWDLEWSDTSAMWDHLRVEPPRKVR